MAEATRHRVLIIGSGPRRPHRGDLRGAREPRPTVVEGSQPGGQLTITTEVENYPGYADGIMGPEMMEIFRKQAERFGTNYLYGDVTSVDLSKRPFRVDIGGELHLADTLIVSTGASAKLMGIPSETRLMGHGVSACATCDGFFFKDKVVGVVGGGDTAMEEANFLTKFATKVYVLHRREALRASKIMQERAQRNPKIEFVWNVVVAEVLGDDTGGGVTGVVLKTPRRSDAYAAAGAGCSSPSGTSPTPRSSRAADMDERGYVQTKGRSTATSVPGVFACGDVQDPTYRQAVTAAGSGCMAPSTPSASSKPSTADLQTTVEPPPRPSRLAVVAVLAGAAAWFALARTGARRSTSRIVAGCEPPEPARDAASGPSTSMRTSFPSWRTRPGATHGRRSLLDAPPELRPALRGLQRPALSPPLAAGDLRRRRGTAPADRRQSAARRHRRVSARPRARRAAIRGAAGRAGVPARQCGRAHGVLDAAGLGAAHVVSPRRCSASSACCGRRAPLERGAGRGVLHGAASRLAAARVVPLPADRVAGALGARDRATDTSVRIPRRHRRGSGLGPLLDGVQLFPALEVAQESVRA
jgi:thioredoxin reductase (NADPH)